MKNFIFIVLFSAFTTVCIGQMPTTSIFSLDFELDGDSLYLNNPAYLTSFNKSGYNNQPSFFNPYEVYFTTNMYNDTLTEVAKLNIRTKRLYRVTNTIESEFSPTLSPDPRYFSCVRIERNGRDQSLWLYPVDRSSYGRRLMEDLDNVGYHLWLSEDEVAMFLVTNPISMVIGNIETGSYRTILENIGRCLRLSQNGEILFVHKLSSQDWYLKKMDPGSGQVKILTKTLPGKEDFEVLPDGSIIMGNGGKLFRYVDRGVNEQWSQVDDLTGLGINNITRMAISEDRLLIVDAK